MSVADAELREVKGVGWDAGLDPSMLEEVGCYACGGSSWGELTTAQDDLTGKPGVFRFVRCDGCGLAYQNPRLKLEHVKAYYDDEYISHRKRRSYGPLTPLFNRAMEGHDRAKEGIVSRYVRLGAGSQVLDVGCAVGTFLSRVNRRFGASVTGVDFKDLSGYPGSEAIRFLCGLFYEQVLPERHFDLITMWHFLEHDYDPMRSLATAREALRADGRLIIEVPRLDSVTARLYGSRWPGLQAPQHTVLYDWGSLRRCVEQAGLRVVDQLPYGAFPAYFYVFAGAAFHVLQGRGLDVQRALLPYFAGQVALWPVVLFERRLNLAMQTIVCARS